MSIVRLAAFLFNNIPFKDNFFTRLLIFDLPPIGILNDSGIEWQRVINENGRLSILTPSILIQKEIHPMSIGDWVEKFEHQHVEKGSHIELETLKSTILNLLH